MNSKDLLGALRGKTVYFAELIGNTDSWGQFTDLSFKQGLHFGGAIKLLGVAARVNKLVIRSF
ncbi:MAG TPA: hypothetical protein VMG82_09305 [Candidatus Sulfotelmatobacter sp.]|nr:hypothetical protein [Candidatus Sulfotelmatobacter sp.]